MKSSRHGSPRVLDMILGETSLSGLLERLRSHVEVQLLVTTLCACSVYGKCRLRPRTEEITRD